MTSHGQRNVVTDEYHGTRSYIRRQLASKLPGYMRTAFRSPFLFRLKHSSPSLTLGEFQAWLWYPFDELMQVTALFRRDVYHALKEQFARHLA
jgi:hypothetical protein